MSQAVQRIGWVAQVNVSPGGVPKRSVERARLEPLGLVGDAHTFEGHGGPERALCVYSLERIQALQAEGHPIFPGAAGENITLAGLDWAAVRPGDRLRIGAALVEVTRYTTPCATIREFFVGRRYRRIHQDDHPGWSRVYTRVLESGTIAAGDAVERFPAEVQTDVAS